MDRCRFWIDVGTAEAAVTVRTPPFTSPRLRGEGRRAKSDAFGIAKCAAGEGDSPNTALLETPPHPILTARALARAAPQAGRGGRPPTPREERLISTSKSLGLAT